jgi:hypothetical protein
MIKQRGNPGFLARAARIAALVFTCGAVLALATKLFLENRWSSLSCGDSHTVVLDRVVLCALACSLLGVIAGVVALARHAEHRGALLVAVLVAVVTAALILLPDTAGGYACGTITP